MVSSPHNEPQNKTPYTHLDMNRYRDKSRLFVCTYFIFFFLGTHAIEAQTRQPNDVGMLSLQECITIAQDQSAIANAARYALVSSKWEYESFEADLLPSLSLSGDAPGYNKSIFSNVLDNGQVTFSSRTQSEASASLSINQNILPTGGNLSLSSGITRLGIFGNENTYLWQSTPLVVGLSQPLFQFNNLKWRNRTEPLRYEIAQKQFVEEMEDIAQTVTQQFFDVY